MPAFFQDFLPGSFQDFLAGAAVPDFVPGSFQDFVPESFQDFVPGSFQDFVPGSFQDFVPGSFQDFLYTYLLLLSHFHLSLTSLSPLTIRLSPVLSSRHGYSPENRKQRSCAELLSIQHKIFKIESRDIILLR